METMKAIYAAIVVCIPTADAKDTASTVRIFGCKVRTARSRAVVVVVVAIVVLQAVLSVVVLVVQWWS